MAMSVVPFGSKYQKIQLDNSGPWGSGRSPDYGLETLVAPPDGSLFQAQQELGLKQQGMDLQKQKFDMMKNLFGNGSSFSGSMRQSPINIPAPHYISAGPVWTQGQIDAQSNLQRGNLLTQANNQSRDFTRQLGARGFSPFSPFSMMNQQSNLMRANAGAAANETNLNFNSAQANSDAELKASGINAGMYGDYTRNLLGAQQANMDYNLKSQGQHQDFIGQLLRSLAA